MSSTQNSAAHWCKTVIEEAIPGAVGTTGSLAIPPPPLPPKLNRVPSQSGTMGTSANSLSSLLPSVSSLSTPVDMAAVQNTAASTATQASFLSMNINPQYAQMYQTYYQQQYNNTISISTSYSANVSGSSNLTASSIANTQNLNSVQAEMYSNASSVWSNEQYNQGYGPQAVPQPRQISYASVVAGGAATSTPSISPMATAQTGAAAIKKPSRFSSASNSSSKTAPAGSGGDKQPASLKEFVKRSFAQCSSDAEREFVGKELQRVIAKVTGEGRLFVHRWDLEPPPLPEPELPSSINTHSSQQSSVHSSTNAVAEISNDQNEQVIGKKRKSRWNEMPADTPAIPLAIKTSNNKPVLAGVNKLITPDELKMREHRANRFSDEMLANDHNHSYSSESQGKQQQNQQSQQQKGKKRKGNNGAVASHALNYGSAAGSTMSDFDMESLKIVGTCQKLEKDYFRLTSPPLASAVRPESVLRKSIQLIKKKWENDEVDYVYMCSQLKSIRQDLTVQHIQNDFTVHVYETHARVALECQDLNEYNQCQTQLKQLYACGLQGNEMEFIAYRVLYYVYLQGNKKYTAGSSDMAFLMASLSAEAESDPAVCHALQLRSAARADNYHSFFQLYRSTPNMGTYILDIMLDSVRLKAVQRICKAYNPTVPVSFVLEELAFEDGTEGEEFLTKIGCALDHEEDKSTGKRQRVILTRKSEIRASAVFSEEKSLL